MTPRRHRRRARRFAAEIAALLRADADRTWALGLMLEKLPRGLLRRAWKRWKETEWEVV